MTVETQYNVVKVNELRAITEARGNDELVINDLDSSPLETKKITAQDFALSIKDYILPIATDTILGGIKIGEGLTINPITGVLTNDVLELDDLQDVIILNAEANQVLRYNGNQWVNEAEGGITNIIAGEGLSGGGNEGDIVLHVNAGPGLGIEYDQVKVNARQGLRVFQDHIEAVLKPGLIISANAITINNGAGLIIDQGFLTTNPGYGLKHDGMYLVVDHTGLGLNIQDGKLGLNIGRGLTLHNTIGKLEALIGKGLTFDAQGAIEGASVLDDLLDVQVVDPREGQVVKYDSQTSLWMNRYNTVGTLHDVTLDAPKVGDALVYDGTKWVNGIGTDPVLYKNTVKCRISLSSTEAAPVSPSDKYYDRVYVTSDRLYLHPYDGGQELGLWNPAEQRWELVKFDGVQSFSLSGCNKNEHNFDVYVYNAGTSDSAVMAVEFIPWISDREMPARAMQDGTYVMPGMPEKRLLGTVRTTTAGNSSYNLGGLSTISDGNGLDSMPHCYIGNLYNQLDISLMFIFGSAFGPQASIGFNGVFGWAIPYQWLFNYVYPRIGIVVTTKDPVRVDHDIACYVGYNHSDACIGVNFPKAVYESGYAGAYGHTGSLELWSTRARSSSPYAGATSSGYFSRPMVEGFNEFTYWWDNCGGGIANSMISHGFNVTFKG